MQVRALPRAIYRGARESSRLAANERSEEAKRRDDKVRRWRQAQRDGPGVAAAARAIGVPLANLYRWENALEPKSKRPHNVRKQRRDPALVAAVERLRRQYPMWGKDKLAPL